MNQEHERKTQIASEMMAMPIKPDLPDQKFKRGDVVSFVRYGKKYKAVIEHCYAQKFGGKDIKNYSVIIVDSNKNNIVTSLAWINVDHITDIKSDIDGFDILETYEKTLKT